MIAIAAASTGCGNDAGFSGESGKRASSDAVKPPPPPVVTPPPVETPPKAYTDLTWFWQCESSPVQAPHEEVDSPVVEGTGPHKFDAAMLNGTPVTFSGHMCEPQELQRDIVFVVDTSGSMQQNDPRVGDTCGRRSAIESVMATITGGNANFGIVTYGSNLSVNSNLLVDSQTGLYADVAPSGNVADTLCATGGGTNYDAGLTRAAELLQMGRENATKEIYFISDGKPNGGQDGIAIANSLKTNGITVNGKARNVVIATVMLAGQDEVLEKFIASMDSSGKPMHAYVAQTAELARVLTDLSANEIVGGELRYRWIGATDYTVVNLMDHLQGFDFVLPSITIDVSGQSEGLEVEYEYWDKHDNRYVTGGKLLWSAVAAKSKGED
jgi:hypothetical protein